MHRNRPSFKPIDPRILALADEHERNPEAILEIFRALHTERGTIAPEAVEDVARTLRIPPQKAYGVATFYSMLSAPPDTIHVCDGPACWLKGAAYLGAALEAEFNLKREPGTPAVKIERSSCLGLCDRAPAALVDEEMCGPLEFQHISKIASGWRGEMPSYREPIPGETRVLLAKAAEIDPDEIDSALACGAYQGLAKALGSPPGSVIDEVEASGLRGRGGAGFPAGRKLRFVAQAESMPKYVVCNADESEPLVFKDRVMIDTNPHLILEGMALAGYATGASVGYIYIRGEYKNQAERLERAIQQAEARGWLGDRIQGSHFSFYIHVHRGAGAYICGEETALLESLEGKRGEPRIRPPFPVTSGFRGQPTVLNNVETFASFPRIFLNGADWYKSAGAPPSSGATPGTKLYTLLGHVNRPGLFEAPFGLTLRQVIDTFGGGMLPGSEFHFALTGGAAGTIVPPELIDVPVDYPSTAKGVSLGAGAILICDQSVSPYVLLRELMFFFEAESCGKCTPCRVGTRQARKRLDRVIAGKSVDHEVEKLADLAELLQNASFCGLGQAAAIPIKSTLKHFPL
jgi:NADH-quinone oxidoreductase subunit F